MFCFGTTLCTVLWDPTETQQCIDGFLSFLWQCYKDLGQRDEARKMCEAACSMNAVSKEVDLITVLLQFCIHIHLTGLFHLPSVVSLYEMHQGSCLGSWL